jgi:signal transduction histidine kinase
MREVITNLLTNALKYTPAGGEVVLEARPEGGGLARLRVTDTGVGIEPDELPHVAERFFRGQRSQQMAAGSGLGLTIVAELVSAHHGELDIRSQPGRGTQVTVTLPRAASESIRPEGDGRHHRHPPLLRPPRRARAERSDAGAPTTRSLHARGAQRSCL